MTPACRIKVNLQPGDINTVLWPAFGFCGGIPFHVRNVSKESKVIAANESGAIFFHLKKLKSRELSTDDDVPYLFCVTNYFV